MNERNKILGSIVGKSRNPEAVGRWMEMTTELSQITENIRRYAGISDDCKWFHNDTGPSQIKTYEREREY